MQKMDIGGEQYSSALTANEKRPNMAPTVYLTDEQVKALGLDTARVGDKMKLHANVCVYSVSSSEEEGDEPGERADKIDVSVSLRLDEAEVERAAPSASNRLYGS